MEGIISTKAAITFCDWFAGATQVKWNRQNSHILASSHDKVLRIWDDRKGAYPLRSIEAHATKIYGVDWNRTETNNVATCSLDRTIKFWDYTSQSDAPEATIHTPFPVWRARHTPFGAGLLAMPQRNDYDLHLYDRRSSDQTQQPEQMPMVHRFDGHEDQVKEFLWRARGSVEDSTDSRDFQLISWGTDRMLRLHRLDKEILTKVGYIKGQKVKRIPFTRRNARYRSFRGDPSQITKDGDSTFGQWKHNLDFQHNASMSSLSGISHNRQALGVNSVWATTENPLASMAGKQINMEDRQIVLSLHGPWGPGRASVFVKCSIEVPLEYPHEESPWVAIASTAGMSDEAILHATSEVQLIAQAYQERHRHSLEAILRYLLGEQSYNDTLGLLQIVTDRPGLGLDGQDGFSSSDEDDENDHQYASVQEPGWESSNVMVAVSNAQYNVPLPKACGALWADDGRLVCFFPPKQDRPPSFLQPLSLKSGEWTSKNRRNILEGFGRLQSGSSLSRMTPSNVGTIESGDSDFDDSLDSTSSDTSSSNGNRSSHLRLMPSMAWREGVQESTQALSVDESQRSDRPNEPAKSKRGNSKNFVSVHDRAQLLPSKRTLAADYQLDRTSECCVHNAAVARKHGELELADTWEFLNLILQDEVPLEPIHISTRPDPIMVIARRAISPLRQKDSAIDLSYDADEDEQRNLLKGPVYWGAHPFGSRWLVEALFEHFEQLADIQMLAMLSCVLQSPSAPNVYSSATGHYRSEVGGSRGAHAVSVSHPLAAIERYYPSYEAAFDANRPLTTKPTFTLEMQKATSGSQSAGSSVGASTSDPMTPCSTGLTPPSSTQLNRIQHERSLSQIPLSTSPEQYKNAHRSSSNLASTLAASLVRPFSFSTPDSSSPPTAYSRNRLSPTASYQGAVTSNSTWTQSGPRGKTNSKTKISKRQASSSPVRASDRYPGRNHSSFETRLKNQGQFQNDGYAAEPLLDATKEERYLAYRSNYASMLLTWELPIASSRVLQYNAPAVGNWLFQRKCEDQAVTDSIVAAGRVKFGEAVKKGKQA
ncbi:MAG: hypothetical protein Q9226_000149 [Calogaya cf. arnoldii]